MDGTAVTRLDGNGSGNALTVEDLKNNSHSDELLWIQLEYSKPSAREVLLDVLGLQPLIAEALLEQETQPRCFTSKDNLFLVLRGVNLNPQADLLDMVAVRVWIEPRRIITTRQRRIMAVADIQDSLQTGSGPDNAGDFLVQLCDKLSRRMEIVLTGIEDDEDSLEDSALAGEDYKLRSTLSQMRRRIITLRRYLAPQRQVLNQLQQLNLSWLEDVHKARLREVADRTTRNVDDLDATRDRAAVAQDELESRHAERINRTMYMLSVVAAVFLPLGLITGLMGVNLAGMPGTTYPHAFLILCGCLVLIVGLEVWLFKLMKWF